MLKRPICKVKDIVFIVVDVLEKTSPTCTIEPASTPEQDKSMSRTCPWSAACWMEVRMVSAVAFSRSDATQADGQASCFHRETLPHGLAVVRKPETT